MNDPKRCLGCNNLVIWIPVKKCGWCPECGTMYRSVKKNIIVTTPNSVNRRKFNPLNEGTENNEYKLIANEYKE